MKRIIIIIDMHCDALLPSGYSFSGGGNKYSRNLIKLLLSHNISFLYFTEQRSPHLESFLQLSNNSCVYRIPILEKGHGKDSPEYINKVIMFICSVLKDKSDSYFLFHSIYWYSGQIADLLSEQYQSYFIHTVISNEKAKMRQNAADPNARRRCEIEQYVFEKAKYIICSSESEASDLESLYHIQKNKLILTGRIIDDNFLMPHVDLYGNPANYRFLENMTVLYMSESETNLLPPNHSSIDWMHIKAFLYVGRIHENKGITQIISAWGHLYNKYGSLMPPLWIAGGSPAEIDTFKSFFVKNLPFLSAAEKSHKLIWWGTLPPESVSTLMSKSLVLVTHSKYEAGGNVILEAMACSLPVIATPFGYGKDLIRHGENGYVVAYNDIDSLEKYMDYFIKQPYLTNYMGRIASADIRQIVQNWNFEEKHMEVYGIYSDSFHSFYVKEHIPKDSIDTYFYRLIVPEETFIYHFICERTNQNVINIGEKENIQNYFLWEVTTLEGTCYFYFLYDVLNRRCLDSDCSEYIITKYQRITAFKEECLKEDIRFYFLEVSEGYAYTNAKVRNIL